MNAALERRTWSVAELALENDDSFSLPVDFYTEPAILALEEERIFARAWNFVGYTAEVASPGDFLAARVAGEGIAVVRGDDSVLRAFYNVCSHRGHPLLCDRGHAKRIVCPYHGWAYELSGALRHARNG
jgi:choline monooxygenase